MATNVEVARHAYLDEIDKLKSMKAKREEIYQLLLWLMDTTQQTALMDAIRVGFEAFDEYGKKQNGNI